MSGFKTRTVGAGSLGMGKLAHLKVGYIAAAGLDVLPVEPVLELLCLCRARERYLEGRLK